jgi:hypothetical protein
MRWRSLGTPDLILIEPGGGANDRRVHLGEIEYNARSWFQIDPR